MLRSVPHLTKVLQSVLQLTVKSKVLQSVPQLTVKSKALQSVPQLTVKSKVLQSVPQLTVKSKVLQPVETASPQCWLVFPPVLAVQSGHVSPKLAVGTHSQMKRPRG